MWIKNFYLLFLIKAVDSTYQKPSEIATGVTTTVDDRLSQIGTESQNVISSPSNDQILWNGKSLDMNPLRRNLHLFALKEFSRSDFLWKILQNHTKGCMITLITRNVTHPLINQVISYGFVSLQPLVVVGIDKLQPDETNRLQKGFWSSNQPLCKAALIDLHDDDDDDSSEGIFRTHHHSLPDRFLEESKVWFWPEARIVAFGRKIRKLDMFFDQTSLRNVIRPIYLTLDESNGDIYEYSRCLFCDDGHSKIFLRSIWSPESGDPQRKRMIPGEMQGLQGHKVTLVSMSYFPYVDYTLDTKEPGTTVTLLDSIDRRMLDAISRHLNFSYLVRTPKDMQPGFPTKNGSWTGKMGAIYFNKADFTTSTGLGSQRLRVIDHVMTANTDFLIIISPKPQLLPQYLVIIRPFTGDVWTYVILSVIVMGVFLWLLQLWRTKFMQGWKFSFSEAQFYSWAVILEDPPTATPTNISGKVLVGFWLIICLLITTYYKSSLISHLTIRSKTSPIDSFEDLIKQDNWKWGLDTRLFLGIGKSYFENNNYPSIKYVYKTLEGIDVHKGLKEVLKGSYSLIATKNRITSVIKSHFVDKFGEMPFHLSREGYAIGMMGWGFRKGAPYQSRISPLISNFRETGIIDYWMDDVMDIRIKEIRRSKGDQELQFINIDKKDDQVVLRLNHLQGVFFIFLLGMSIATITYGLEKVA